MRLLACDERHPAGVEPQRLRRQHQALPPIAHRLVLRAPVGDERDVGGGAAHEAHARDKPEHLGVVGDDLDVQFALADALVDDHQQRGHRAAVDGIVAVRAHRMARADDIHDAGLVVHAGRLGSGTRTESLYRCSARVHKRGKLQVLSIDDEARLAKGVHQTA